MQNTQSDTGYSVVVETTGDDLNIHEVATLLRALLLAYGFQQANVDEIIEPE